LSDRPLLPTRARSERPAIAAAGRSRPSTKTNDNGRARRNQPPKRSTRDEAGSRIWRAAASAFLRDGEVFGLVLGARTGWGRTGRLGDTDRTGAGITHSVRGTCRELAKLGRLGLSTWWFAAIFVVAAGRLFGAERTFAPGGADSVVGVATAATGPVVGETTLGAAGASTLPAGTGDSGSGDSGSGDSGSEIGSAESSDPPQVGEAGV
jgi:hypothetical protein